jgi:hypothetical protein
MKKVISSICQTGREGPLTAQDKRYEMKGLDDA